MATELAPSNATILHGDLVIPRKFVIPSERGICFPSLGKEFVTSRYFETSRYLGRARLQPCHPEPKTLGLQPLGMVILRTIAKTISTALAAIILLVSSLVAYYDWREIRPYLPNIQATLANSAQEDRDVPSNIEGFIWKVEKGTNSSINWQVVRNLLPERYGLMQMGTWHFRGLMWSMMLPLHFDKHTRTALYCHYLVYENGRGLSNAAEFYFHKQPHELTPEEIAAILAIDWAPSINSPLRHPEAFEKAKKRFLAAYESHS